MSFYGKFNSDGSKFSITRPDTPRPFDTMLFNNVCYSNIHQTGLGCFDYQFGDSEGIQLLSGVGRVCDNDIYGKEHLYNRLVYIRDNDSGEFWTLNWEPVCKPFQSFLCTHGIGYTLISNVTNNIKAKMMITIPPGDDAVELWKLTFNDVENKKRNLSIFVYLQVQLKFKSGFDSYGDAIYRKTEFDRKNNIFYVLKHPYIKPHEYLVSFFSSDCEVKAFDGSRKIFIGQYGTVVSPKSVVRGNCNNSNGSAEDTICALQWNINDSKKSISFIFGATDIKEKAIKIKNKYVNNVYYWKKEANKNLASIISKTHLKCENIQTENLLNNWVKLACLYGSLWCRWGYYGYRDIVQHAMGVVSLCPEITKNILLKAISYQYSDGMAVRGWNPLDNRPYSDSFLWVIYTLTSYIKETGDLNVINEVVPYFDKNKDSVINHILTSINFFQNNKGKHGLLLIKFGDWNDSLTSIGKEGKGESVWLSMAYIYALTEFQELLLFINQNILADTIKKYEVDMRNAVDLYAWEEDRYIRCFKDDGNPVGSKKCKEAKIFLETQSFAFITQMGDNQKRKKILQSINRELKTPLGYMILSPSFKTFDDKIGRISYMEPGIAENGTVYIHPNIWLIYGLLKNGFNNEAWDLFYQISPGFTNDDNKKYKDKCLPYQYANCYYGSEHRNNPFQMEYSWVTGSVAWIRRISEEWMFGIRPLYNGLKIDPHLPDNFKSYRFYKEFRGCKYIINVHPSNTEKVIYLDGEEINEDVLPIINDKKIHNVTVNGFN